MSHNSQKIIVVGAGVAGLTLAYKLLLAGRDVLVVEKESEAGGLARSFKYDGFVFDIGPHRFYSEIPEAMDFVCEILGDDCLTIERRSGVWMFGSYFDWPLTASSLLRMPLPLLLSVGMEALKGRDLPKGGRKRDESFEEYIVSKYGRTLFTIFFKPYTEKFLGVRCSEISRDWAITGIDRAVIDRKIEVDDLPSLARSLWAKHPPLKFIYPKSGGISTFSKNLVQRIKERDGAILLHTEITGIIRDGKRIEKVLIGGEEHKCDLVVWSGPIPEILRLLGDERPGLDYLSLLLFNYRTGHSPYIDYQWCYYGAGDIPFNRISIPSLFNASLAPPGKSGICAEVTCREGESVWERPEIMESAIRNSLLQTGVIRDERGIIGLNIERVANAYPVFTLNYAEKLKAARETLDQFCNLKLLGRTGSFWYNNMDHSILAALDLYREISAPRPQGW